MEAPLIKIRHEHFEDGTNQTTITGEFEADNLYALILMLLPEDLYDLETVGVEDEQDIGAA